MAAQIATTEAAFVHHLQALAGGNMDDIMSDYLEESILLTPQGTFTGLEQIRGFFVFALTNILTGESLANFKVYRQEVNGDYAYIFWSAAPNVVAGGDTFHVRNGKIIMQAFAGYLPS